MYKTTAGIDGMACSMCEAHVCDAAKKALFVRKARASRRRGELVLLTDEPVSEAALRRAIEPTGYAVTSFACAPYEPKGFFAKLFG